MKLERLTRRLIQLRAVANHIDSHLDAPLTLDELADVANLSRFHFERVFASYAGETPLARVRRLRLDRARRLILAGKAPSLLDLALDSGYASAEAFSRAFRLQFGCAPSSLRSLPSQNKSAIRIEKLPALPIQYLPYEGQREQMMHAFDELRARAMLQEIPKERRKGWRVDFSALGDGAQVRLQAALLSRRLGTRVAGLDSGALPAGRYAVIEMHGSFDIPPRTALAQRIEAETGWLLRDAPVLQTFHNPTYLPAQHEKRCEIYVPVQRSLGCE